jgi:radical SAM superfamily enzyme YgiQ (UPF0313 family)
MRKIALVCATPAFDTNEMPLQMPSYGINRIHAAALASATSGCVDVKLFDLGIRDYEQCLKDIQDFNPDVVGFSVYVWSMDQLLDLAKSLKEGKSDIVTVFGGPSARRDCFKIPYYFERKEYVDILCEGDGEKLIQDIIRLPRLDHEHLSSLPGIYIRDNITGWQATQKEFVLPPLDSFASPYQLKLMPENAVAYLETYRGCPLSCNFCAWGETRPPRAVFSDDYIVNELKSFRGLNAPAVFLLDAGLNLNAKAFRNLAQAHLKDGFLSEVLFWAEIYPTIIKPEHLDFLKSVGTAYLGVGLQTIDPNVLKAHNRPFDMTRFTYAIEELSQVAGMEIQIIMGLPEDTPEGFRKTLDFALSLPVNSVRVYHCLVLPDALLSRGHSSWKMNFDPVTLTMRSNHTWSTHDIYSMRQELNNKVARMNGEAGDFWWSFRK